MVGSFSGGGPSSGLPAVDVERAAAVFAALGDPTRVHLVTRLCDAGPLSITRLTEGTELTRQAVTKHLRVLADAGLATSRRSGRERHWRIEAERLEEIRGLLEKVGRRWDVALGRLRVMVEGDDRVDRDEGRNHG